MIYNVDSRLQVFLLPALLKIPTSVRARTVLFWHFKIRTECLQRVNVMSKHGQRLSKRRGRWENVGCFFAHQTFAVMTLPNYKRN